MFLDFAAALRALGGPAALVQLANAARPPAEYLWADVLPERNVYGYHAEDAAMTVRSTMAGMVAMDSPYPPGGYVDASTFQRETLKIATHVPLSEQTLRTMQEMVVRLALGGGGAQAQGNEAVAEQVLNFAQKILLQPLLDRAEWMRGQAILGKLDWTFNNKRVEIDYQIPTGNILPARTGTAHYGGSASAFWSDVYTLRRKVRRPRIFAHPETVDLARYNPVNSMVTLAEGDGTIRFRKVTNNGAQFTQDAGDVVDIIVYDGEGEILNPNDPSTTIVLPFCEPGKLIAIGQARQGGFVVGRGSTAEQPPSPVELGYHHIGPTTENNGRTGRWVQVFTPEGAPWSLHGRAASNEVPVMGKRGAERIAIASTALS